MSTSAIAMPCSWTRYSGRLPASWMSHSMRLSLTQVQRHRLIGRLLVPGGAERLEGLAHRMPARIPVGFAVRDHLLLDASGLLDIGVGVAGEQRRQTLRCRTVRGPAPACRVAAASSSC